MKAKGGAFDEEFTQPPDVLASASQPIGPVANLGPLDKTGQSANNAAMRIIAGQHGGRKILGPKDDQTTRPITDRVKQAVFDKLSAHGMFDGGQVVDLFSGTGSMGLESLSRGSAFCTFVDQDKDAVERLNRNLDTLGLQAQAQVCPVNLGSLMWTHGLPSHGPIQIAFVDPPYALMAEPGSHGPFSQLMTTLLPFMDPTGVALLRVPLEVDPMPVTGWRGPRIDRHGSMKVAYYAPEVAPGTPANEAAASGVDEVDADDTATE